MSAIRPEKTEVFQAGEIPSDAEPSNLIPGKSKSSPSWEQRFDWWCTWEKRR